MEAEHVRTLDNDFIGTIHQQGRQYRKIGIITALAVDEDCQVVTREGTLPDVKAGCYIATDGVSIWPIAPDFMKQHYVEV